MARELENISRRMALRRSVGGAAFAALFLHPSARPTRASSPLDETLHGRIFEGDPPPETLILDDGVSLTDPNAEGPFYTPGAPFRGKVCPPLEPGTVLVVTGRVWSLETRRPVGRAMLDLWQADMHGVYDNGDGHYKNRARLVTTETGYFEFETIHPAGYGAGNFQRSPHIHFKAIAPGHKPLTSEMFFEGDPHQDVDPLFIASLVTKIERVRRGDGIYELANFDIVLESD